MTAGTPQQRPDGQKGVKGGIRPSSGLVIPAGYNDVTWEAARNGALDENYIPDPDLNEALGARFNRAG